MTALTVSARPEDDASLRPVPWRRMAWVTWRQHRFALAGVAALLGALAVYVWIVGLSAAPRLRRRDRLQPGSSPACGDLITNFNFMNHCSVGGYVLQVVPALIGAFVGAPVLARELETGTFRYAWTQGFGRWRWTLAKLVPLAVVVTAAAGAFSVLFSWYYQPYLADGQPGPVAVRGVPARLRPVRPARGRVRRLDAGRLRDRRPGRHAHPPGRPRDRRHPGRLHRARPRGRELPAPALPDAAAHQQPERARFRVDHQPVVDQGRQVRVRRPAPIDLLQQLPSVCGGARQAVVRTPSRSASPSTATRSGPATSRPAGSGHSSGSRAAGCSRCRCCSSP